MKKKKVSRPKNSRSTLKIISEGRNREKKKNNRRVSMIRSNRASLRTKGQIIEQTLERTRNS